MTVPLVSNRLGVASGAEPLEALATASHSLVLFLEYLPFFPLIIVFLVFPVVLLGFNRANKETRNRLLVAMNLAGATALCFLVIATHGQAREGR